MDYDPAAGLNQLSQERHPMAGTAPPVKPSPNHERIIDRVNGMNRGLDELEFLLVQIRDGNVPRAECQDNDLDPTGVSLANFLEGEADRICGQSERLAQYVGELRKLLLGVQK